MGGSSLFRLLLAFEDGELIFGWIVWGFGFIDSGCGCDWPSAGFG